MTRYDHNPQALSPLAWAGWQMSIPGRWRPVRIEGQFRAGNMMLADGSDVVMQIKWWHPPSADFKPAQWLQSRLKHVKAAEREVETGPAPAGFGPVACVSAGVRRNWQNCRLWYGYHENARLVLEIAMRHESGGNGYIMRRVRSLTAHNPSESGRWAIYGCSFQAPPEFRLKEHSLRLGDMSLLLAGPKRQSLLLRQVYPADLALNRRIMQDWINTAAFRQRRRYRPDGEAEPMTIGSPDNPLQGVIRFGSKRLAFPLGRLKTNYTAAAVLHDVETGRLLIAEHDARDAADRALLEAVLLGMNRSESLWSEGDQ